MKSFTIKKLKSTYKLENFNYSLKGFHYPIKKPKRDTMKIKEIIIINPDIISSLICHNFYKKYQKIIECLFNNADFNDDNNSGTNLMMALDEVAHLRTIIIKKYQKYLKKKEAEELLKKLKILENELRIKIIDFKLIKEQELVNNNNVEKCQSR